MRSYFPWIAECCALLGWPKMQGAQLVVDPSWYGCFDDGMTPAEAVAEAKRKRVLVHNGDWWILNPNSEDIITE